MPELTPSAGEESFLKMRGIKRKKEPLKPFSVLIEGMETEAVSAEGASSASGRIDQIPFSVNLFRDSR